MDQIKLACGEAFDEWRPTTDQCRTLCLQAFLFKKTFSVGDNNTVASVIGR